MLVTLNVLLAMAALIGGLLSARAYLPNIEYHGNTPSAILARGLIICACSAFPRSFVWDLLWRLESFEWLFTVVGAALINSLANGLLLIGIWHILYARLMLIPEDERWKYNIITAVGYPGGIVPFKIKTRNQIEEE